MLTRGHARTGNLWFGRLACLVVAILAVGTVRLRAQTEEIPDQEAVQPPSPSRINAILTFAAPNRWVPEVQILHDAAAKAYAANRMEAAQGWFNLYRWSTLFCEGEPPFTAQWVKNVTAMHAYHNGMARTYNPPKETLAAHLTAGTEAWLVGNQKFSDEFFSILSPVDYVPEVFNILNAIHTASPNLAEHYGSLALAIAVVYDVPPAQGWPHAQVSTTDLPRHFPPAVEAFMWFVRQDQAGKMYHHLDRLPARQLKYVIDAAAPFPELEWSQEVVNYPLSQFEKTYPMIHYRNDRASSSPIWGDGRYTLPTILSRGGICVDQAYFATEAGKARGIPTILFFGAGRDGRHAWFGFLDGSDEWQYDAGRYAEQRLVTGSSIDPQTWTEISDHELQFANARFRLLPAFTQSRVHEEFAREFINQNDLRSAEFAARKATEYESRNLDAWNTRLSIAAALNTPAPEREAMLRSASLAFSAYPDLAQNFVRAISASLRSRGEASLADMEEKRFFAQNQSDRVDLAIQQAQLVLLQSMTKDDAAGQVATFNHLLDQYGSGAGAVFFDKIVVIFVEHLAISGAAPYARKAADHAREVMGITPGSQLDADMIRLVGRLDGARN